MIYCSNPQSAFPGVTSMLSTASAAPGQSSPAAMPSMLGAFGTAQTVGDQEVLFREGDEAGSLFEVVQGVVRLYRLLPDGRRSVMGFAFPGTILGLSFRGAHLYTAETITPSQIRRCGRSAVAQLLSTRSEFRHRLLEIVSDELCAAQDQMLLLGRKSAPERVVSFLLWVARKMQDEGGNLHQVDLPMSRADIADYLGLTTETVSREITKLKQAGLVDLPTPQRVQFLRRDVLREIAENGEAEIKQTTTRLKSARWPS